MSLGHLHSEHFSSALARFSGRLSLPWVDDVVRIQHERLIIGNKTNEVEQPRRTSEYRIDRSIRTRIRVSRNVDEEDIKKREGEANASKCKNVQWQ
jgi:hypothetical protein